jgi:hypothetical protein
MRGSGVIAGAIIGAVSFLGVPAQASAAPDPYSPSVETDCRISVPAVIEPGKHVVIRIRIAANSPTPPTGEVELSILTVPGGKVVWTKTVVYNGGTQKVIGPVLPEGDDYRVVSRFAPDAGFAKCRSVLPFLVDDVRAGNPPDDNDDAAPGGLLPDTGGPALLWLLLGLGLVGGGTATVVYARRRSAPVPA